MKGPIVSVKDGGNPGSPHSEIDDSVIDRLLLRYLSRFVSRIRHNKTVVAHLVVGDSLSKAFDQSRYLFGILPLIYEPSRRAFRQ